MMAIGVIISFAAQGKKDRAQKTWDRIEQDNYSHKFSS
jgi:hypothetical protein